MKNDTIVVDKKTLEALDESIKKWYEITYNNKEDEGATDCPLCEIYNIGYPVTCDGCPVEIDTGKYKCKNTPYLKFINTFGVRRQRIVTSKESKEAAIAMLHYLLDLRTRVQIKIEFEPMEIKFNIETEEKLIALWHRLNISETTVIENVRLSEEYDIVSDILERLKIDPKDWV